MPESVNCVWYEGSLEADNRSRYATNTLLNNAMDRAEVGFIHRNGIAELPGGASGAVVVIHGERLAKQANEIVARLAHLTWLLTIIMGDEPRAFDSRRFVGPRRKIWRQYPIPGRHDHEDRRLVAGYPADCPTLLDNCKAERLNRTFNFSFAGQANNQSRRACIAQLRMMPNGYVYVSPGFWLGLPRDEYYRKIAESKIVACPAGGARPESLRVFESLEAGCIPVVEDHYFNGTSYWKYVLGEDPPFPTLSYWTDFPSVLDRGLKEWPVNRDRLQSWWKDYKAKMPRWFEEDLNDIR